MGLATCREVWVSRSAEMRWGITSPRSICRHVPCCRRSCRGPGTARSWTGRASSLPALSFRMQRMRRSGRGITHLQYARHGLGGQMHVLEARRAFDRALELDSGSVEANLYRVYMLLSRGEKE